MQKILIALLVILLSACASTKKLEQSEKSSGPVINITESETLKDENERGFWIAYSLSLAACSGKHYEYSMEFLECSYRLAGLLGSDDNNNSKVAKDISRIIKKGLLREYLWTHLRQKWWFEPYNLALEGYKKYIQENPLNHIPTMDTGISFQPSNDAVYKFKPDIYNLKHPQVAGDLFFNSYQLLEGNAGHKIAYTHKNNDSVKVDLYIYQSNEEHTNDDSYSYSNELATGVKVPIYYYSQRGMYGPITLVNEEFLTSKAVPSPIAKGSYKYQSSLGDTISIFLITYAKGMLIKVRASMPVSSNIRLDENLLKLVELAVSKLND